MIFSYLYKSTLFFSSGQKIFLKNPIWIFRMRHMQIYLHDILTIYPSPRIEIIQLRFEIVTTSDL